MSDQSVASEQLKALKKKLDAAIKSRSVLEENFQSQSSILVQFIGKLSQVCKGIDLELDNKLANFRILLTKSAPISEIEVQINLISTLLLKLSTKNDANIRELHQQFHAASTILQKINGLPDQLRRNLRTLVKENQDSKEAIIQYVPPLTQLITLFETALNAKMGLSAEQGLLSTSRVNNATAKTATEPNDDHADKKIINKFSSLLDELVLSDHQKPQINVIKRTLTQNISRDELTTCFIKTFDLILINLQNERETAESFLSTLSKTLSTVQSAVKNTLTSNSKSKKEHSSLNNQLQKQVTEMTSVVETATSLTDIREDIQEKLQLIANTIKCKNQIEQQHQQSLEDQLTAMSQQIDSLEKQSKQFEKRLHEQQLKSMQDALTKLNNRAAFDEHFAKEMVRFHKKSFSLAIAVIDIDDFKKINDTYGHSAGDKTLQVIANTMKKQLGKEIFIARYGGEEFVLVYNKTIKTELLKSLENLRKKIASLPFKFKQDSVSITLSIGATHVQATDNIHLAFERADKSLYRAKASGKNKVIYL